MKKLLLLFLSLVVVLCFGVACDNTGNDENQGSTNQTMNVTLSAQSFNYDGNEHFLIIDGDLPENAVVEWLNNGRSEVGTQTVCAIVKCKGYNDVSLKADLTVVGQDVSADVALVEKEISVNYGDEYAFAINDVTLLPEGYTVTEIYVDKENGDIFSTKPIKGGEFRYVLTISKVGYNTKTLQGDLTISRPAPENVEISNLPTLPDVNYLGKNAVLPGIKWVPEVKILPEGSNKTEIEYSFSNARISYVDGAVIASNDVGTCDITVAIKDTAISKTYTIYVADTSFVYEDFEDSNKELFLQKYVTIKNEETGLVEFYVDEDTKSVVMIPKNKELVANADGTAILDSNGKPQFIDKSATYYGATSSINMEIQANKDNSALHLTNIENFDIYYAYFEINSIPSGGWTAGRYRIEMEVDGDYAFILQWAYDNKVYDFISDVTGVGFGNRAEVKDGKVIVEFSIFDDIIGAEMNAIRFAQTDRTAIDVTIDNVLIMKIG